MKFEQRQGDFVVRMVLLGSKPEIDTNLNNMETSIEFMLI
jgi:hypothetical protein